jgi:hypothetical protein
MFRNKLKVAKEGKQTYILLADLVYEDALVIIRVKSGFDFDAASIPKIFWSIIGSPFTGNYVEPATVHDALYSSEYFNRKQCDDIFLEVMKANNVSKFKRYAMYGAVRLFGGFVWSKHVKDEVNEYKKFISVEYKPIMV